MILVSDYSSEVFEFLDQVNYCLSMQFRDKWKHRFSLTFLDLFQDKMLEALEKQKPLKRSVLESMFIRRHKYSPELVSDFFGAIDIDLYYPLVTRH